jgi:hypothetical protein
VSEKLCAEFVDGIDIASVDGEEYVAWLYANGVCRSLRVHTGNFKSVVPHCRTTGKPNSDPSFHRDIF